MTVQHHSPEPQHTAAYVWPAALSLMPKNAVRVLEIGCGNGAFARTLVGLGYTITAFDASPSGVRLARENQPPVDAHVMGVDDKLPRRGSAHSTRW